MLICIINQAKIHKIMRIQAFTRIRKCQFRIRVQHTDQTK